MYHTVFNSLLKLELKFSEVNQINKLEATCPMTFEEENARCLPQGKGYNHKIKCEGQRGNNIVLF